MNSNNSNKREGLDRPASVPGPTSPPPAGSRLEHEDLERLAAGLTVPPESLWAILADPNALAEVADLVRARNAFGFPSAAATGLDPEAVKPASLDVTFDELADALEGGPSDSRRDAARRVLEEYFPEALAGAVTASEPAAPSPASSVTVPAAAVSPAPEPKATGGSSINKLLYLAAGFMLAVGFLWFNSDARAKEEMRRVLERVGVLETDLREKVDENKQLRLEQERQAKQFQESMEGLRRQLQNMQLAVELLPRTDESFRREFDRGRGYRLHTSPEAPARLNLAFSQLLRPPYYMGLQADWGDGTPREMLYYANKTGLDLNYSHDYTPALPKSGEKPVTITIRFHTTDEAAKIVNVGYVVEETIPLILTPGGVRIASSIDAKRTTANIESPKASDYVRDQFLLDLRLGLSDPAVRATSKSVIHVLVRPTQGGGKWQEQYLVVPFHQRVSELPDKEATYKFFVSLRGILNTIPKKADFPPRFEILVVELPFELTAWTVDRKLLDLGSPALAAAVRDRIEVGLKPDWEDE